LARFWSPSSDESCAPSNFGSVLCSPPLR